MIISTWIRTMRLPTDVDAHDDNIFIHIYIYISFVLGLC